MLVHSQLCATAMFSTTPKEPVRDHRRTYTSFSPCASLPTVVIGQGVSVQYQGYNGVTKVPGTFPSGVPRKAHISPAYHTSTLGRKAHRGSAPRGPARLLHGRQWTYFY